MNQSDSTSLKYPPFVAVTKDAYNAYHIRTIQTVPSKQFLQFVEQFTSQQIQLNKTRELLKQTTAIWIILTHPNLSLVTQLCQKQYQIHSGLNKTITLNRWIATRKNLIPAFSVFYVSCCAVLIKDNCIFLVQQKTGQRKNKYNLPGGRADPGQTIIECVERQLFQQTNIKAKFKYIIDFRQATHSIYNSVDCYYACLMQLEEKALDQIKLCERELICYKWVPLSQYLQFCMEHNSTSTQIRIAQFITSLWKQGYDFHNGIPNRTVQKIERIKPNSEQQRKTCFHELIYIPK